MLSIEGLKVSYGHVEALKGIDIEVRQGNITAIIGSNGAGKTTLLKLISRMTSRDSASPKSWKAANCSQIRQSRTTCCSAAILTYCVIARVSLR